MKKRLFSLILVLCMAFTLIPVGAFAEDGFGVEDFKLCVNPYCNGKDSPDTISWFQQGLEYYLFLPADCDTSDLTVYYDSEKTVVANGKVLKNGERTDAFSASTGVVAVHCGFNTYIVHVMKSANIPAMFIRTEESMDYINADKNNKSPGAVMTYEGGELTLNSALKQIKGRGNSTWDYDKKGYNIKFDAKTALLGMPKAKKWSMLACYIDPAMDKNPLGWELAEQVGLDFSSEYRFVDLYINNEYYGTYIICESVEIGENRVDITDLTKATEKVNKGYDLEDFSIGGTGADGLPQSWDTFPNAKWVNIPNNPKDITGGYLLECEYPSRAYSEVSSFATTRGQSVVVKEPEYASEAQVKYISAYWQEAEDAICSPNGRNSLGKHYSEYFDVDSLVNMYILLEFSGNYDTGISSTFFYKDAGGKLVASPIWDNDSAFGNLGMVTATLSNDPSVWVTNRVGYGLLTDMPTNSEYPTIYNRLYRLEEFRALVSERWVELGHVFNEENINGILDSIDNTVHASCLMNGVRWFSLLSEIAYDGSAVLSKSYVKQRIAYLNKGFAADAAQLYYDPNGGTGWCVENKILSNGEPVIVKGPYCSYKLTLDDTAISPPAEGMRFAGWNTEPDGSGRTYLPGSTIAVNGVVTLYAQWKNTNPNQLIPINYRYAKLLDNPAISITRSLVRVLFSLHPVSLYSMSHKIPA